MNDIAFKAISDKTRRKILNLLSKNDTMNAGEIAAHFNMSKPAISEHLKILRNARLIYSEKKGQFVEYHLNSSVIQDIITYFAELIMEKS